MGRLGAGGFRSIVRGGIMRPVKSREPGAYTLLELLIVIAIIFLLAGILLPVLSRVREKARQTTCLSNLKQIGLGMAQYSQDSDNCLPLMHQYDDASSLGAAALTGMFYGYCGCGNPRAYQLSWQDFTYPYIKNINVFVCPSSAYKAKLPAHSYGYNYFMAIKTGTSNVCALPPAPVLESALVQPASKILVAEKGIGADAWYLAGAGDGAAGGGSVHNGGANLLFCDFHAKWVAYPSTWNTSGSTQSNLMPATVVAE